MEHLSVKKGKRRRAGVVQLKADGHAGHNQLGPQTKVKVSL